MTLGSVRYTHVWLRVWFFVSGPLSCDTSILVLGVCALLYAQFV
jgi:hypothetical protein